MRSLFIHLCILCYASFGVAAQDITIYKSNHSFSETVSRLDSIINSKGYKVYDMVVNDFETDSVKYMNRVIQFEIPDLTQQILACEPTAVLDLPLRILVWKETEEVYLAYVDPAFMKRRFRITNCNESLKDLTKVLVRVINECIREV